MSILPLMKKFTTTHISMINLGPQVLKVFRPFLNFVSIQTTSNKMGQMKY